MLSNRQQRKIRQQPCFETGFKESASTDDSDCSNDYCQTPARNIRSNPRKQKLELCKKFMQSGFCPYYARCKFAHGSHQLRKNNEANFRYKTKECGTFFIQGHCHYGNRCNFLHQQKVKPTVSKSALALTKLQNFGIQFFSKQDQGCNTSKLCRLFQ